MKKKVATKRAAIIVISIPIIIAVILAGVYSYGKITNKMILDGMMASLTGGISDETNLELVEARSVYGKLNGNGNGIQYFGCVLVEAESEQDVTAVLEEIQGKFEVLDYCEQRNSVMETGYLEHRSITYEHSGGDGYYSIFLYDSHHEDSAEFDLAGR